MIVALLPILFLFTISSTVHAGWFDTEPEEIITKSSAAISAQMENPEDSIPLALLHSATCLAVYPGIVKAGLGFGAGIRMGNGLVTCKGSDGKWNTPLFAKLRGGSFGFELGFAEVNTVLVFITPKAKSILAQSGYTFGAELSITVGPKGKNAQVGRDFELNSDIYIYARSRGLYVEASLTGAQNSPYDFANEKVFNENYSAATVLDTPEAFAPAITQPFLQTLRNELNSKLFQ